VFAVQPATAESKGNPGEVYFQPVGTGPIAAYFREHFQKSHGDKLSLEWSGKYSIHVPLSEKAALDTGRIGFYDRAGVFVGAVFVPLWVPIPG